MRGGVFILRRILFIVILNEKNYVSYADQRLFGSIVCMSQ